MYLLLQSNADAINKNPDDPDALLFSKLFQLEDYKTEDGKFHLKIVYPGLDGRNNEWTQKSNQVTDSTILGIKYCLPTAWQPVSEGDFGLSSFVPPPQQHVPG